MKRNYNKDFVVQNYAEKGIDYCMKELNLSRRQVVKMACYAGVRLKKTNCLDLIMPFSKESVYLLGFLNGDGYVGKKKNTITIEMVSEDARSIDKVLMILPWKKYKRKRKEAWKETTTYYVSDEFLHTFLVDTGFYEKSQKTPKVISMIPNELKRFFLLGLFDADGCVQAKKICNKYYGNIQISASKDFDWSLLLEIYEPLIGVKFKKCIANHGSTINLYNKADVFKFYDYIYLTKHEDGIGLDRKYLKFDKIS